jgi:hypothetical protein
MLGRLAFVTALIGASGNRAGHDAGSDSTKAFSVGS